MPLNENVPPGAIRVPSISLRDELDVVEPPGRAAVGRRVRRDDARRCPSSSRSRSSAAAARPARRGSPSACRSRTRPPRSPSPSPGTSSWSPGADGPDHDLPASRSTWKCASCGLRETVGREPLEVLLGAAAGDRDARCCRRRAARAAARSASAAPASASRRRRAGSAPRARCAPASRRRRGRRASPSGSRGLERQRDGRAAVERRRARRRSWPRRRSRSSCRPVMPSTTRMSRPWRTTFASTPLRSTLVGDLGELVAHGRVVGRRPAARRRSPKNRARRRLKPRSGPKPPPSAAAVGDGAAPVRLDPELRGGERERLPVGGERDRACSTAPRPVRRARAPPAPRDIPPTSTPAIVVPAASSVREPAKARPTSTTSSTSDHRQEDGPAQGNPAGGLAHAGAVDRRVGAHRTEDSSGAAARPELAIGRGPRRNPGERLKPLTDGSSRSLGHCSPR